MCFAKFTFGRMTIQSTMRQTAITGPILLLDDIREGRMQLKAHFGFVPYHGDVGQIFVECLAGQYKVSTLSAVLGTVDTGSEAVVYG